MKGHLHSVIFENRALLKLTGDKSGFWFEIIPNFKCQRLGCSPSVALIMLPMTEVTNVVNIQYEPEPIFLILNLRWFNLYLKCLRGF